MTGWIRLSCPVSLRTQIRHGSPFNWESLPAEDRFASTIDSRKAGSFRWAAPTRKMFLELSALRASDGVADPRRPCEQESSFFRPVRKSQWRKPLLGLERTWDSLAGLGPEERRVRALPECRPAVSGPNTSSVEGVAGRTIDEKGVCVGRWVGFESARESLVQTGTPARESSLERLIDIQAAA